MCLHGVLHSLLLCSLFLRQIMSAVLTLARVTKVFSLHLSSLQLGWNLLDCDGAGNRKKNLPRCSQSDVLQLHRISLSARIQKLHVPVVNRSAGCRTILYLSVKHHGRQSFTLRSSTHIQHLLEINSITMSRCRKQTLNLLALRMLEFRGST